MKPDWRASLYLAIVVVLSVFALVATQVASHRIRRNLGPALEPLGSRMIIGDPPFQEYVAKYRRTFHNHHSHFNDDKAEDNYDGDDNQMEAQCAACADGSI